MRDLKIEEKIKSRENSPVYNYKISPPYSRVVITRTIAYGYDYEAALTHRGRRDCSEFSSIPPHP
jgi:hypothetical protein